MNKADFRIIKYEDDVNTSNGKIYYLWKVKSKYHDISMASLISIFPLLVIAAMVSAFNELISYFVLGFILIPILIGLFTFNYSVFKSGFKSEQAAINYIKELVGEKL